MPIVRSSKLRHVFVTANKRDQCYESIPISRSSVDNAFCAVNPKFVAIITEASGGGSFMVLPIEQYGRVDMNQPRVSGHKDAVHDVAWSPFNDNIIASASEDTMIKIWYIPDEGLKENLTESEVDLCYHQKKALQVIWHPTAENVLLSIGGDNLILIWKFGGESGPEVLTEITCHTNLIFSASWNMNGSLIASACKDKKVRIIDPRTGEVKQEGDGCEGPKPQRVQLLNDNKLLLTGFSKRSERRYKLFNVNDMSKPLVETTIDTGSGTLAIFYDADLKMIYLAAKGDGKLLYYELTDEAPYVHYLDHYQSSNPQRGLGYMPKRGLDVNKHEVARFYKLHLKGICEPLQMRVPRKSELFQDDIYPDCASGVPSLTAEEWFNGKNANPKTMSMDMLYKGSSNTAPVKKASSRLNRTSQKKEPDVAVSDVKEMPKASPKQKSSPASQQQESLEQKKQIDDLVKEVARLKATVMEQGNRIKALEARGGAENGN